MTKKKMLMYARREDSTILADVEVLSGFPCLFTIDKEEFESAIANSEISDQYNQSSCMVNGERHYYARWAEKENTLYIGLDMGVLKGQPYDFREFQDSVRSDEEQAIIDKEVDDHIEKIRKIPD